MVRNKKIITVILAGFVLLSLIQPVMTRADEPREPDRKAEITILVNEPPVDNETNDINMMGAAGKKVVVDPGHGKEGSPGDKGYLEYKAMWELANHLKDALERCGVEVHLTKQSAEENPSLEDRGKLAKDKDLFISLHSNAFSGESVDGCEVYYSVEQSGNKKYAEKLSKKGSEIMGNSDRGAETKESEENPGKDYYGVIRSAVEVGCPHVFLVESGFHTNDEDRDFLQNDAKLKELAEGYAEVICDILNVDYIDEKAGAVIAMINALPEVNKLTLEDKAQVEDARAAYDALTKEQKALVTNSDKLEAAEAKIEELESEAEVVKNMINALPEVNKLTLEDKTQVEEARAAYDALTEEQKDLVTNSDKLTKAEAKIEELESEAEAVETMIDALPEVDELTLKDKTQVEEARAAYDALTKEQKDLVTNSDKLTKAEAKIEELLQSKVNVETVIAMINALPEVDELELEHKAQVEDARTAYDALTKEKKDLVTNSEKLTDAEAKIEELEAEAVKTMINDLPEVDELTLVEHKAQVEEARAAYEELTEEQQKLVTNSDKLEAAEERIGELYAGIEDVKDKIDVLPEADELTLEDEDAVKEARTAYNALTEEQKKLVTNSDKLEAAEERIGGLYAGIEDVEDKIANLFSVEDLELEHKAQVEEARAAYDALTEEQQKLVTNLDKLIEAETKIEGLEVEAVEAMINDLPEDPTLGDREAIEEAWTSYNALTEEQQESVENIAKLIKVEEKIRVEIVKDMIDALPEVDELTLEDEGAVEDAREAYDALAEEQKALVSEEHVDKLEAAEERIGELIKVETVKNMIDALPEVDELTLEDEDAVKEARTAYDALTKEQKDLVTNLDKLTEAEAKIEKLESEAEAVKDMIDVLPEADELTLEDEDAVKEARTAYDALTKEQKDLVTNLDKLTEAEAKIEELKEVEEPAEKEPIEKEIEVDVEKEIEVDVITEDQDGLTKTGDSSSIRMYIAIALIAATLILLLIKPKKKHS